MKLISLGELVQKSTRAVRRFPWVLFSAAVGTCAAVWIVELEAAETRTWLHGAALAAVLGIPLYLTIALVAERKGWTRGLVLALNGAGSVLLLAYAASLPQGVFDGPEMHIIRFWLLVAGLHFLVAVAPFSVPDEIHGFWHHNRILLLRLLTAALYSTVLYGGLSIALLSLEKLFNFTIVGDRYFQLWLVIAGVFNTWFFVAGIPADLAALQRDESYPKGLKIFSQYVLLPLVTVYLLILYAYEIKILVEWDWPRGWVSNLVLGFSTAGIFALLLLWPLREITGQTWIRVFTRRYFLALVPLLLMLVLAIWRRIGEYGLTENRYVVAVLGLWLAGMVIYFLARRAGNIKVVPASLAAFAFLSAFGPWGAFSVSERSQMGRLEQLLLKNGILAGGRIVKAEQAPPVADAREISSILGYLGRVHGVSALEEWFQREFDTPGDSIGEAARDQKGRMLAELMGVPYHEEWHSEEGGASRFSVSRGGPLSVSGFDYLIQGLDFAGPSAVTNGKFTVGGVIYEIGGVTDSSVVSIRRLRGDSAVATIDLIPLLDRLDRNPVWAPSGGLLAASGMTADGGGGGMRVRLLVESLWRGRTPARNEVTRLYGSLLLRDSMTQSSVEVSPTPP